MIIRWNAPTESGLADRLTDIFYMATYGRVRNSTICFAWKDFKPNPSLDVKHRSTDILLENVQKYISFPKEISCGKANCIKFDATFDSYIGGSMKPEDFYLTYLASICSEEKFQTSLAEVAKDFVFSEDIRNHLNTLPENFMTFHIRRGDKVRKGSHDGCFITSDELNWLNDITYKSIDYYINQGFEDFFICGDEDHKMTPFINYINSKNKRTFTSPSNLQKWQKTYYDLGIMTKSKINVTSQRFSSFSRFPSLIGNGIFKTVIGLSEEGII